MRNVCQLTCMDFTHVKWTVCRELSWWLSLAKQKTIDSSMYQLQLYNSNSIIFATRLCKQEKLLWTVTTIRSMLLSTYSFIFDRLVQCIKLSLIFSIFTMYLKVKYKGKKLDQFKTTWFRKQHSSVSVSIVKDVAYDNISLSSKAVYVNFHCFHHDTTK